MTTQRIPTNTNAAIISFVGPITGDRFTQAELIGYVNTFGFGTTSETIMRALRTLRQAGKINYSVANRKLGIFVALPLDLPATESSDNNG